MKYVILPFETEYGAYCYTCDKCGSVCDGKFDCVECPNVAYACIQRAQ